METRYSSSGRVQPIQYGNMALPGTCLLCNRIGHTQDEVFATLGVELEFYGLAYLCLDCCAEIADFIMFKPPARMDALEQQVTMLVTSNFKLQASLAEAKGLINARIDAAGRDEPRSDGDVSVSVPEVESGSAEVNQDTDGNEPVASQSSTHAGLGNAVRTAKSYRSRSV